MVLDPAHDLVLVGPGRLGRSVRQLLLARGHPCLIVGRGEPIPKAALTWLLVPDRVIAEVARAVPPGGVILHASGASDLLPLRPHPRVGSLHPLMSFPGPELGLPQEEVPAAVAGDPEAIPLATELAELLGWHPFLVPGDRRAYHAAAVMAGNLATALLGEAARVLASAGVDPAIAPGLLAPLALTSIRNAAYMGPARALTGPIARGDEEVISAHRAVLSEIHPEILPIYEALTRAARALVD